MARDKIRGTIMSFIGERPVDFAATAAGVGLSGTILGWVRHYTPLTGVSDEIVQALTGLALINYGDSIHSQVPNIGRGVLLELLGRIAAEKIGPMIPAPAPTGSSHHSSHHSNPNPNPDLIERRTFSPSEALARL